MSPKDWYKDLRNWKQEYGAHPNYSIVKISQNTKKSSGGLKRLAVTQTPVEDHCYIIAEGFFLYYQFLFCISYFLV